MIVLCPICISATAVIAWLAHKILSRHCPARKESR